MKIDLFFINKQIRVVIYKLNLFLDIKIHSIFHILSLKLTDSIIFIQNIFHFQLEKEDKYKIKAILT